MHRCTVSRSVTCTPRKPFNGQCNLSFSAISLTLDASLDGLQVCSIAGKKGKEDEKGHDFRRRPHSLCDVCNWGVVIRLFFDPMNGLHFADPHPQPAGN